ncbi:1-deoxy-D-xylulose-5-phosphate synthase [Natranaerobius thermophilus]|uniref:1-deoxy-D-xylulose-5-phosphate synthase n=1 Tax=Natranaerobius thermophilus (strain ATCC BAA-1301 / DSM 18059 / JW/NM-WN-LF) TaxID=457570 RepID=DXS_NATTJ|nr:1-deoxy-D-xylulose-5-phosphate synthase [Natranaerobius thermophilus]B2A526.1 RecName: Full=1-deoxy-D-xylulose-5-phosphate synthase; AltName: Full=1-deoxyxylulose-5-phosphate synthase; Short=DXP synthase; Short=DXPS [Natranaerobius thermophilus JW/NM-WN-LF]ACB85268.1 1-Deoxy-D-xylulose-5-phosphate synthase [Natranaerobius thermophilus JW/NM-WN-LF]
MTKLLSYINTSEDLKHLSTEDLNKLAEELREFLISSISITGGHLAPNLGVVELTLAIHKVFSPIQDKIVWDVGHQSYIHKILTGRKEQFSTLRQFGGLSGFPKPEESRYDAFGTGHSSTSISAALGMAKARDLQGSNEEVLAVIGDGAMTGGMAFEAMNHAGHEQANMTVILNDNEMSIGTNVGALSSYLSRLRTDPKYHRIKEDVEFLLKRIPAIGGKMMKSVERVKDSMKYLMVSGMLFEELGFTYIGPIDGHNIPQLMEVLNNAKDKNGPVLVHVITKKGKGYEPAEKFPDKFHGTGPFEIETGNAPKKAETAPSYSKVFGDTISEIARKNESVVAITAAMKDGTGLTNFAREFPERFFDVGIAEQHAITFAAGLARKGFKPVVAIYSTFLQRAYDQIIHDVCMQDNPVIFAIDRAGIVGGDGETHQGLYDLSYLRSIPNLIVMAPKDEAELQRMLNTAVNINKPVAIRYPRGKGEGVTLWENMTPIPLYKGETIREGSQVAMIGVGKMVPDMLEVADMLKKEGIEPTVFNARFVKPLDESSILEIAQKHEYIYTFEENTELGGFGSQVLECLSKHGLAHKLIDRFCLPDEYIPHGDRSKVLSQYSLHSQELINKILNRLRGEQIEQG